MNQACEPISPWEEHLFWLEILDDHSIFVRDFLSPTESHWVVLAQQYSERFRYLRAAGEDTKPKSPDP
ncbi:DUF2935 domain-containing protein [Paenibacillus sp. ATY16]|uniref:DUF2935 domain-containing protein n=1 Tax=Paenibacillus sp. ATY16 TaxID=1759312 RepID=UPI00200EE490|nr:DUF2935 domain-containing protein [Paenibacillus sp. ATY16]MCK9858641.1 DUF2935 domain-containing protein [Paenibacillus sp. ATY16]